MYITCVCCTGMDYWKGQGPEPTLCYSCRVRGQLCLHNLADHREQGAHSTRRHGDDSGADNPATCQWCLAKLLDQAYLKGVSDAY